VTAFHPDYHMTEPPRTSIDALLRAHDIGREAGLHFVYAGNLPGFVGERENTFCPGCGRTLIERHGFGVRANHLDGDRCPECHRLIPGVWA
jgi:pyruvate formate lyase activating enzyme